MGFLIYASVFRVFVILAGVACTYMGYRLFVLGVMPSDKTEVNAQAGEIRLTLKNAAPGTCFALFGAFIIIIMLWQSVPELKITNLVQKGGDTKFFNLAVKSDDTLFQQRLKEGDSFEKSGDFDNAIKAYAQALSDTNLSLGTATEAFYRMASVYFRKERFQEALVYARLIIQVKNEDVMTLVLISHIESKRGNYKDAINVMELAVELDPKYKSELEELRRKIQ